MNYDLVVGLNNSSQGTWQLCHIQTGRPDAMCLAIKVKSIKILAGGSNEFVIEEALIDIDNRYLEISDMRLATPLELTDINRERQLEGHPSADIALKVFAIYSRTYPSQKIYKPSKPLTLTAKKAHKLDINMNAVSTTGITNATINDFAGILVGPKICTFRVVW